MRLRIVLWILFCVIVEKKITQYLLVFSYYDLLTMVPSFVIVVVAIQLWTIAYITPITKLLSYNVTESDKWTFYFLILMTHTELKLTSELPYFILLFTHYYHCYSFLFITLLQVWFLLILVTSHVLMIYFLQKVEWRFKMK